jgi:two-component system sensor histidine kinase DesK
MVDVRTRQRRGMRLGLAYLAFMAFPIADLASGHRATWRIVVGAVALLVFAVLYIRLYLIAGLFRDTVDSVRRGRPYGYALAALAIVFPLALGKTFVGLVIFAGAGIALVLPPKRVLPVALGLTAANLGVMLALHISGSELFSQLVLSVVAPLSVMGIRQLVLANQELMTAREENARLAVSEERLRFARDLHDLLGHSLSLIVLKSELAGRMIERDVERAAGEVRDIESVARQALVEVREAVSGYRRSFDEELVGARNALQAADIAVVLPVAGPPLPAPVESLLGWAVREATTNVLRHSRAEHVTIKLDRQSNSATLTVEDDGIGPAGGTEGHGLAGLAERMAAAGGSIEAGSDFSRVNGGFRLRVVVPMDAPSYASAPRPEVPATLSE